ncbi:hypothetical protein MIR68_008967 [Amoeboaphelidium protococcarum]|nr:hypothetical protein MIR68_008967 [Amoeboaphelidium protococcarum]
MPSKDSKSNIDQVQFQQNQVNKAFKPSIQFLKSGNIHEAYKTGLHAQQLLTQNHDKNVNFSVEFHLACLERDLDKLDSAITRLHQLSKVYQSENLRIRCTLAEWMYLQKSYDESLKFYLMAYDSVSGADSDIKSKIASNIAKVYLKQGSFSLSLKYFESAVKLNSNFGNCFNLLVCQFGFGNQIKVQECFQSLMKAPQGSFSPDTVLIMLRYAVKLTKFSCQALKDDAMEWMITLVQQSQYASFENDIRILDAWLYAQDGLTDASLEYFQQLGDNSDSLTQVQKETVYTVLASFYYIQENGEMTRKYGQLTRKKIMFDALIAQRVGDSLLALKLYKEAAEQHIEPAMYNLALLLKDNQQYSQAHDLFAGLSSQNPFDYEALFLSAECLRRMARPKDALQVLNKLRKSLPGDASVQQAIYQISRQLLQQ